MTSRFRDQRIGAQRILSLDWTLTIGDLTYLASYRISECPIVTALRPSAGRCRNLAQNACTDPYQFLLPIQIRNGSPTLSRLLAAHGELSCDAYGQQGLASSVELASLLRGPGSPLPDTGGHG